MVFQAFNPLKLLKGETQEFAITEPIVQETGVNHSVNAKSENSGLILNDGVSQAAMCGGKEKNRNVKSHNSNVVAFHLQAL